MEECKNRIGERCKLNGELCGHLVYDGCCKFAELDTISRVTIKEALDTILTSKCCQKRKDGHRRSYEIMVETLGLDWNDPIEKLEYELVEELVNKLKSKYSTSTISRILGSIYYSGNILFRTTYKNMGKKIPIFEKFPFKDERHPKDAITWEQKNSIEFEMEKLRQSALDETRTKDQRTQSRNKFIALWWGRWFGTRPGDINTMKWGNITNINGIPHAKWTPNKTKDSTNCDICWPIDGDAFNQISKFIGGDDEFCLTTDEKYVPVKNRRSNKNLHTNMWKSLNKMFRRLGFSGWGGFYNLRYMSSQETYKKYGEVAESIKHGHSISTGKRSYYNGNDHSL